jgi:hypothetical protein
MTPIKYNSVEVSHPALEYREQRDGPMLSLCAVTKKLQHQKRSQLDRLYQRVIDDLDKLMDAVGLKAA